MRNAISYLRYGYVKEACDNLPEPVKRLFNDIGCTITIVPEIEEAPWAAGAFYSESTNKYASIEITRGVSNQEFVTYHEFGHLLDYGYDKVFKSEYDSEFISIYHEEKANFITDYNYEYATSNSVEYFAEAFAEYMTNPDRLRENTPKTYDYIVNAISNTETEAERKARIAELEAELAKINEQLAELEARKSESIWTRIKRIFGC